MADGLAADRLADPARETALPAAVPAVVLAVTATGREAEDLTAALRAFLPADAVAEFPSWETLPHERLSPALGHRGPAAVRPAPAGAPRSVARAGRCAWWWRRYAPWSSPSSPAWANWCPSP